MFDGLSTSHPAWTGTWSRLRRLLWLSLMLIRTMLCDAQDGSHTTAEYLHLLLSLGAQKKAEVLQFALPYRRELHLPCDRHAWWTAGV